MQQVDACEPVEGVAPIDTAADPPGGIRGTLVPSVKVARTIELVLDAPDARHRAARHPADSGIRRPEGGVR
jgi:hypothetical protein